MKYVSIILLLFCFSCKNGSVSTVQNGDFKIEFLFEQDGCKLYRFKDGIRYVYWSDCRGMVSESHTTSTGKSTTIHYSDTINSGK